MVPLSVIDLHANYAKMQMKPVKHWENSIEKKKEAHFEKREEYMNNKIICYNHLLKRTLYSEKNMNSLNVEYFLAMNIQNLDKNG